ncbi:DNA repair ATPase [Fulvitalea axinellae]
MSETTEKQDIQLDGGTYEVLKTRLRKESEVLRERLNVLNENRKDVFGAIDLSLLATERVTTEYNCVPWDMCAIGDHFLFGYNVHMGLKVEYKPSDVFSMFRYDDLSFVHEPLDMLQDEAFVKDFKNLYKYYKGTRFVKFARMGQYLHMVFRIGQGLDDIKTFKWLVSEGELRYVDARSDHELKYPSQHEFEWIKTTREQFCEGEHPHISIEDIVFVETVGGDLTIKVEDNTEDGKGIYNELVQHKEQRLEDAEVYYAILGHLVILKIKPYQEEFRYFVYNAKLQEAIRIDALEDSCILLPENHGLIFSNGYYLQSGDYKQFDNNLSDMLYERCVPSPNGEDFMYVFYNRRKGIYLLLHYNLIAQKVESPAICHGYSTFENGEMCMFRADDEPKKHHVVQIWQTPYVGPDFQLEGQSDSFLYKIGNKDIVKAMAECQALLNLVGKEEAYRDQYLDIIKMATDSLDTYHWLGKPEASELAEPLKSIRETAVAAVDEYEKVRKIQQHTNTEVKRVSREADDLIARLKREVPQLIGDFVQNLTDLRKVRGEVISLKELRYVDESKVEKYEASLADFADQVSKDCVRFLLKPEALEPYAEQVEAIRKEVEKVTKVVEADALDERITAVSNELEMLIETVSNLKIDDATEVTRIIDSISGIYSSFNQIKASLKRKRKELMGEEGRAEFNAQIKLVDQGAVNFLDLCDTPEKCEEYMTKLMVQLEELEGKFSEFDEFIDKISVKRDELYNAFESKKITLVEARNRRATTLQKAAERIIASVKSRLSRFKEVSEINGYMASDMMVEKVRGIVQELFDLGDSVKADDIQSRLKTAKEDALRQLKDKSELFVGGDNIIRFGTYDFAVNTQPLDLTMVYREGRMFYHLSGTNFFEEVTDEEFNASRPVWDQATVAENREVYRGEYLAYLILKEAEAKTLSLSEEEGVLSVSDLSDMDHDALMAVVQRYMALRYSEGYVKGVHDHDATKILEALLEMQTRVGLLRYGASTRALAGFYWNHWEEKGQRELFEAQIHSAGIILRAFPDTTEFEALKTELGERLQACAEATELFVVRDFAEAADYLFEQVALNEAFVVDGKAYDLRKRFESELRGRKVDTAFGESVAKLEDPALKYRLVRNWLKAFTQDAGLEAEIRFVDEVAVMLLDGETDKKSVREVRLERELEEMQGAHDRLAEQRYGLHFHDFNRRLGDYASDTVPMYGRFQELKQQMSADFAEALRLSEFKPRVLSSFVRNQLLDKVYLPIIGANLAKQIGTAGEGKRTDLMGMLLLISPPGYGKTTIMEYVANRLGLVFMKINGPALGHEVVSVDPAQAGNAGVRQELEKLNLAFEMGDNVMIYLDDIQHCNPEFLQKFISLCDGQRKIEGVYKGKTKTYDFRGKKVCVVMAGNPYTESGDKFRIPDMLANRADIYNLGDILGESDHEFKLSYIQNCLTSNATLAKLAAKSHKDVLSVLKIAETGNREGVEFEANHSATEIGEYTEVLKKLLYARDVILKVNLEYIRSAGQAEEFRTEPPFKLQGSYRDMNKIAEKVVPVMNDKELRTLMVSHYEREAQTLTAGAEANLLKFRELIGIATDDELTRWEEIKEVFRKKQKHTLSGGNQLGQMLEQVERMAESLGRIAGERESV